MRELDELAGRFWAWRARQQPRTRDDIPRLERPAGWLPEVDPALDGRRAAELAAFTADLPASARRRRRARPGRPPAAALCDRPGHLGVRRPPGALTPPLLDRPGARPGVRRPAAAPASTRTGSRRSSGCCGPPRPPWPTPRPPCAAPPASTPGWPGPSSTASADAGRLRRGPRPLARRRRPELRAAAADAARPRRTTPAGWPRPSRGCRPPSRSDRNATSGSCARSPASRYPLDEITSIGRREYDRAVWLELLYAQPGRDRPASRRCRTAPPASPGPRPPPKRRSAGSTSATGCSASRAACATTWPSRCRTTWSRCASSAWPTT